MKERNKRNLEDKSIVAEVRFLLYCTIKNLCFCHIDPNYPLRKTLRVLECYQFYQLKCYKEGTCQNFHQKSRCCENGKIIEYY